MHGSRILGATLTEQLFGEDQISAVQRGIRGDELAPRYRRLRHALELFGLGPEDAEQDRGSGAESAERLTVFRVLAQRRKSRLQITDLERLVSHDRAHRDDVRGVGIELLDGLLRLLEPASQ